MNGVSISMKKKLVSIIMPCYNCKKKIEDAILSVLKQDMNLIEFIIVDGASTDGTQELLEKYKDKIKYISEKDNGIYDAMNKGISLATGKYLYFLGVGDYLCDNIIHELKDLFIEGKYDFIYGNYYYKTKNRINSNSGKFNKLKILFENISHQVIFYKKKIFKIYIKYNLKYKTCADYELNIKCIFNNKIKKYYVKKFIAIYEGSGFSDRHIDTTFKKDINNIIKENGGYFYYIIRLMFFDLIKALQLK